MIEEILQKEKGDIPISRIKRCDRCLGCWLEERSHSSPLRNVIAPYPNTNAIANTTIRVGTNQKLECNESHNLTNLAYFIYININQ
jgi:hypothetical protein